MAERKTRRRTAYQYTAVFTPADEGGYTVTVPALPGLVSEGDSLTEARSMVRDAIRAYVESLVKDGEPVPRERRGAVTRRIPVSIGYAPRRKHATA